MCEVAHTWRKDYRNGFTADTKQADPHPHDPAVLPSYMRSRCRAALRVAAVAHDLGRARGGDLSFPARAIAEKILEAEIRPIWNEEKACHGDGPSLPFDMPCLDYSSGDLRRDRGPPQPRRRPFASGNSYCRDSFTIGGRGSPPLASAAGLAHVAMPDATIFDNRGQKLDFGNRL